MKIAHWILQVDVDAPRPGSTPGQNYVAVVIIVLIAAGALWVRYRNRFAGLEPEEQAHKAALNGSRRDQTPRTLRIPSSADPADYRDRLVDLFDSQPSFEQDRVTGRDAARSVLASFRESWRPITSRLSAFVIRLVSLAWLVAIFGALAVSTDAVVRLILVDTSIRDTEIYMQRAIELSIDVLETGRDALLAFPYIGELASFALAFGTLAFEWLYTHYWLVALGLLLLAVVIAYLERQVSDELETRLYERRRGLLAAWVGSFVLVWLAGVVPAAIGSYLGAPETGARSGFGLAMLLAAGLGAIGLRRYVDRLKEAAYHGPDESGLADWYLLARRTAFMLAVPGALLVITYALVFVATGKMGAIGEAILAADLGIQALLVGVVVLVVAGIAYLVRSAWPDVRAALIESLSRTELRAVLFWRGSLAVGFVVGYLLAFAFTRDIVLAMVLGPLGAAVGLAIYELLERAKYRVSVWDRSTEIPRSVTVQAYRLRDDDGDRHPFAIVNGRIELARDDVDDLVDEVLEAVVDVQTGEEYGASIGTWHAASLFELGQPDEERTRARVKEHARKLFVDALRPAGRVVDVEDVQRACEGGQRPFDWDELLNWEEDIEPVRQPGEPVPTSAWEWWRDELAGDVVLDHGEQLELLRDPWEAGQA